MAFECRFPKCGFQASTSWIMKGHERYCNLKVVIDDVNTLRRRKEEEGCDIIVDDSNSENRQSTNCTKSTSTDNGITGLNPIHGGNEDCNIEARILTENTDRAVETLAVNLSTLEGVTGTKSLNELIQNICNPDFSVALFKERIRNVSDCKKVCKDIVRRHYSCNGFEEVRVNDISGKFISTLYYRNPIELLRQQMQQVDKAEFLLTPQKKENTNGDRLFQHVMETDFGRHLCTAVMERVKLSESEDIFWNDSEVEGSQSFAGLLQCYSDKSATTLKKSGISAYPLHIVFMNLTYEQWKKAISNGSTLLAYLPVDIEESQEAGEDEQIPAFGKRNRDVRISLLHKSFTHALKPLEDNALRGFIVKDSHGCEFKCHPVLASICADIPEGKDLSSILHGTKVNMPCFRCETFRGDLNLCTESPLRTISSTIETRRHFEEYIQLAEKAEQISKFREGKVFRKKAVKVLKPKSLYLQQSYFESCTLLLQSPLNNMYNCLTFEMLHNFDLGISKLIKTCIYERLGCNILRTNFFSSAGDKMFKSVRTSILHGVNDMLRLIEQDSQIPDFHVDFSGKESGNQLNGLYKQDGLTGMLEAKNYRSIDTVFPFIATYIDRCCGELDAPITSICTQYIDILTWCSRRQGANRWNPSEIKSFKACVKTFMESMKETFEKYHPSGLCTLKFHLLTHIHEDIEKFGNIQMLCADHYENRHLIFKQQYQRTSKRKTTAVKETIARVGEKLNLSAANRCQDGENLDNPCNVFVPKIGLVARGVVVKLREFRELLDFVKPKLVHVDNFIPRSCLADAQNIYHSDTIDLFVQTFDQGGEAFLNLLKEEGIIKCTKYFEFSTKVTLVKSGTVLGGHYCSVDDIDDAGNLVTLQREDIFMQRVVACQSYGNSKYGKYSFVLLKGSADDGTIVYWVGQVRALILVKWEGEESNTEYAFIKYMEVVEAVDAIDDVHGCICLRWSTDDEIYHNSSSLENEEGAQPSPWFGLEHFTAIQSVVHVVRQNYPVKPFIQDMHWSQFRYCLNRFQVVGNRYDIK